MVVRDIILKIKEVSKTVSREIVSLLIFYCQAEMKGKNFLCRTAASFVSARVGITPIPPLLPKDVGIDKERNGGLIVVGSYVPKTTKQASN